MSWLTDAFEPQFMQRALVAGVLAGVATSVVGTWIVVRGLAFLGDALAHGVVPGLALAVLWGFNPIIGALGAALVMALAVTVISSRTHLREDTGIGLLFVGMLALGVIIVSKSRSFSTSVTNLLFGEILGVTPIDLRNQAVATLAVVTAGVVLHRPLLALAFNPDKAMTLRMHPIAAHAALMVMLAVSLVASFQAIGTLLVFGLLIGPPATATLLVHRVWMVTVASTVISAGCVVGGMAISFHHSTAGGATISAMAVAIFFVVLALREAWARSARRSVMTTRPPAASDGRP
jgi:ABC-type Mn2+/Zn2+ transport system permease subunit